MDKLITAYGLSTIYLKDLISIHKDRRRLNNLILKYKNQNNNHNSDFFIHYLRTLEEVNNPFKQILQNIQNQAFTLNYSSIYELIQAHSWTDYDHLAQIAERYIHTNSKIFKQQYLDFVSEYHIGHKDDLSDTYQNLFLFYQDMDTIFGNFELDSLFTQIDAICAKGKMIFMNSQRLHVDIEDSKRKSNPGYLGITGSYENPSFVIVGKQGNLGLNLHEAGHAIHYLNFDKTLSHFDKNYGNMAITEAVAFLFNNLLLSPKFLNTIQLKGEFNMQKYLKYQTMSQTYSKIYQAIRFLNFRHIYSTTDKYNDKIFSELKSNAETRFEQYMGFNRIMGDCFEVSDQLMQPAIYFEAYMLCDYIQAKLQSISNSDQKEWWECEDALIWLKNTIILPGFSLNLSEFPYLK